MQSTKQSVGIIIIENLGTERGLRQSHGLSFYIALTSKIYGCNRQKYVAATVS